MMNRSPLSPVHANSWHPCCRRDNQCSDRAVSRRAQGRAAVPVIARATAGESLIKLCGHVNVGGGQRQRYNYNCAAYAQLLRQLDRRCWRETRTEATHKAFIGK